MPSTIGDVEQLGYTVGIAHGDVPAEEQALAQARADTHPDALIENAQTVTMRTVSDLDAAGVLPTDPAERQQIAAQIADAALTHLTERAEGRVEFHERAVEIAKEMPDVWVVSGPGITSVYVPCKPDGTGWTDEAQAFLDALSNPEAHKERSFQEYAPGDVVELALEARSLGATVDGDGTEDSWSLTVDGTNVKSAGQLEKIVAPLRP